jgi:hypothetical protein
VTSSALGPSSTPEQQREPIHPVPAAAAKHEKEKETRLKRYAGWLLVAARQQDQQMLAGTIAQLEKDKGCMAALELDGERTRSFKDILLKACSRCSDSLYANKLFEVSRLPRSMVDNANTCHSHSFGSPLCRSCVQLISCQLSRLLELCSTCTDERTTAKPVAEC